MDDLQRLVAMEEIRQLIARRARLVDGKHWEALAGLYTDDVVAHHLGTTGPKAMVAEIARALEGIRSIHHVHLPEITMTSPTTGTAIVPMEDILLWEVDGVKRWAHGFGHYFQRFLKTEKGWRISDHKLTRQYVKSGDGEFEPTQNPGSAIEAFEVPLSRIPLDFE